MQLLTRVAVVAASAVACAGGGANPAHGTAPVASSRPRQDQRTATAAPEAFAKAPAAAPAVSSAAATSAIATPRAPRAFTLLRKGHVTSLAVARPPKIGVFIDGGVILHDGRDFRELPKPPEVASSHGVQLYFGRDDQPRLMGNAPVATDGRVRPVYLRFKAGRWQPEPSELGPLGAPDGALYGVLGWDDPEVVCRPGAVCLIKRISGWKSVPAHAEPMRVLLSGNTAWALARDRVERLDKSGFVVLEPRRAFNEPSSLLADEAGAVWVGEPSSRSVHRLAAGAWQSFDAAIGAPRALFGEAGGVVWVAGDEGAAFFHDGRFHRVASVNGPLAFVARSGSDLWFAGAAGVFRAQPL